MADFPEYVSLSLFLVQSCLPSGIIKNCVSKYVCWLSIERSLPLGLLVSFCPNSMIFFYFENKQLRSTRRHFSAIQHWIWDKHTKLLFILIIITVYYSKAMFLLWTCFVICVCLNFAILQCMFIAALWSHVRKELTSWLSCMFCFHVLYHFP